MRILEPDIFEVENIDASQQQSGNQNDEAGGKEDVAHFHRAPVWTVMGVFDVNEAEHDDWQDEQQTKPEMRAEHQHVEPALVSCIRVRLNPFKKADRAQVN